MCDMAHLPPARSGPRTAATASAPWTARCAWGPAIGDDTGGSSSYQFRAGNAFSDTRPGSALSGTRQRPVPRPSGTGRCRDVSTPLPHGHATEVLTGQRRPARLPAGSGRHGFARPIRRSWCHPTLPGASSVPGGNAFRTGESARLRVSGQAQQPPIGCQFGCPRVKGSGTAVSPAVQHPLDMHRFQP